MDEEGEPALSTCLRYNYMDIVWRDLLISQMDILSGSMTAFTYNADGLRISKDTGDVTYRYNYDGSTLLQQKWGNTSLLFLTDASGQYYAMMKNGILYYYVHNAQGDVIGLLDGDGAYV